MSGGRGTVEAPSELLGASLRSLLAWDGGTAGRQRRMLPHIYHIQVEYACPFPTHLTRRLARAASRRPLMKKLSLLGIIIGAALLTAAPVSIQRSPKSVMQLSLDKADAQYGVYRRHYRRAYRRAYRRSYYGYGYGVGGACCGYGYPGYGGYGYPGYAGYGGYGYPSYWYGGFGGLRWW